MRPIFNISEVHVQNINPEYSLEGLMLKLKLQYFGYLMQRANSLEKTLMLGKTEGRGEGGSRGWDDWRASSSQWTSVWTSFRRQWRTEKPGVLLFLCRKASDTTRRLDNNVQNKTRKTLQTSGLYPNGLDRYMKYLTENFKNVLKTITKHSDWWLIK